ncbi:NAD(P)-dependent oxidoreductase [Streptomyces sp. YIM B13518]|uniref:NAD(P)-dependent oxidoreductase n=1 Tax=Streptomyces sp. YIM B13518 TaxID=3366316 RepID=UPI00367DEB14
MVREEALHEALVSGAIAGTALDAWGSGPPDAPSRPPFHDLPNVLMPPHHPGHTADAFTARATEIAANTDRPERGTRSPTWSVPVPPSPTTDHTTPAPHPE